MFSIISCLAPKSNRFVKIQVKFKWILDSKGLRNIRDGFPLPQPWDVEKEDCLD